MSSVLETSAATATAREEFEALVAEAAACRRCPAMCGRSAVLSDRNGGVGARVMFVGEAPGRQGGDRTRVPFSGDQSGRNFTRYLASIALGREEVFITNAALCNPRTGTGANRKPTRAEVENCSEFLRRQIEVVAPSVVVTLGAVSLAALRAVEYHRLTLKENVGQVHAWHGRLLVPLYHPSPQVLASHRREAAQLEDYKSVARALLADDGRRTVDDRRQKAEVEGSGRRLGSNVRRLRLRKMAEALEQNAAEGAERRSPLEEAQRRAGASFVEHEGCVVAASYGDARAEYEAVRGGGGAGLFDLSARGRLEVSGGEAVQFLNGMVTNDVARLEDGAWMHAAFPNPQGRLVASVRVIRRGGSFLFDTEAATYGRLRQNLERFTFAGDFRLRDLSAETAVLSVQGARAAAAVGAALGASAAETSRGRVTHVEFGGGEVAILRATHTAEDGFDLFAGAEGAEALWGALVGAGARPCGFEALEVLRVEAGLPRYGVDASEANVVLEVVDEEEAVSYTKGCYAGQEIIARIHWRGHVAKRLAGVVFDGDAGPPTDARLRDCAEGREVGRITSTAFSPRLRRHVALALVKYDFLRPGTELKVFSGEAEVCAAHVAELPLVRGSWYAETTAEESE